ncbi:hypothetical protein MY10362_007726 [Beauveria mimosiformis]
MDVSELPDQYPSGSVSLQLPPPIHSLTTNNLLNGTPYEVWRSIESLQQSHPNLSAMLQESPRYSLLCRAVKALLSAWDYMLGTLQNGGGGFLDVIDLIDQVDEPRRERLLSIVLTKTSREWSPYYITHIGIYVGRFGAENRDKLVSAVLAIEDDGGRARAIARLAHGLSHLTLAQRTAMMDAALAFEDEYAKGGAIAGFGHGLECLDPVECDSIIAAVAAMDDAGAELAIAGLVAGFEHLSPEQRSVLFSHTMHLADLSRARVLLVLGGKWEYLTPAQRDMLLQAPGDVADDMDISSIIVGIVRNMRDLSEPQRAELFDKGAAIEGGWHQARIMQALGSQLEHLSVTQRTRLVNIALENLPWMRGQIIAGIAPGFLELDQSQRDAIVDAALRLDDTVAQLAAITGLATALCHLSARQQSSIVDAASSLLDQSSGPPTLGMLCRNARHLDPTLRTRLFSSVLYITDVGRKSKALADMGPFYPYLGPEQQSTLVDMALHMLMSGMSDGSAYLLPGPLYFLLDATGCIHLDSINGSELLTRSPVIRPNRSISAAGAFTIDLDLTDTDTDASPDDQVSFGQVSWTPGDDHHVIHEASIGGAFGHATIAYVVMNKAAQAEISFGERRLFNKADNAYIKLQPGQKFPLDRSTMVVPMDDNLVFDVNVWDHDADWSPNDQVATGRVVLAPQAETSTKQVVSGEFGQIQIRVTWS